MDYEQIIDSEVRKFIGLGSTVFNTTITHPDIKFSKRLTKCAAYASKRRDEYEIVFSIPIIQLNSISEYISRTVPHEVAHILQWQLYGEADHGETFYYILKKIGIENASRCHSYTTPPKRNVRRYAYKCDKCGKELNFTPQKHKRGIDGATFKHTTCGGNVIPV